MHSKKPAANPAENDLWIFRDGRCAVSGPELLRELAGRLARRDPQAVVDSLIRAGELETALADAGWNGETAAELTDALALRVCAPGRPIPTEPEALLRRIHTPNALSLSPPEGFTYYALHPADFAAAVSRVPPQPAACAVIGIRSIGTTLSAMTMAELQLEGRPAARMTVRPTGHPYSRATHFSAQELEWIRRQLACGAQFLVVDEGPGRSGSTFLSVAEALQQAGVPTENITMIGSRQPDVLSLCAVDADTRWRQFRFLSITPSQSPKFATCQYAGGGAWRDLLLPGGCEWPESWTQMERLKFVSADRRTLLRFEGMGRIGEQVRGRAFQLADAGFSPSVRDAGNGFLEYSLVQSAHVLPWNADKSVIERIAQYCAFRATAFPAATPEPFELGAMLEFNVFQEFGVDLQVSSSDLLPRSPILCDGRMQPHEWVAGVGGNQLLKVDAVDHGDNHFFPGICDVAWDIAGVAIEWHLSPEAVTALADEFRRRSGIDVSRQLQLYEFAYSVFRLGFCKMAISSALDEGERSRLRTAYARYRTLAEQLLLLVQGAPKHAFAA